MSIKRVIARVKIAQRRRAREKADREVEELTLERNKALREAEIAAKVATAKEKLRWAKALKYREEATIRKKDKEDEDEEKPKRAKVKARVSRKRAEGITVRIVTGPKRAKAKAKAKASRKKAKGIAGRTIKSLRKLLKI